MCRKYPHSNFNGSSDMPNKPPTVLSEFKFSDRVANFPIPPLTTKIIIIRTL